jgi:uncharacterized membrane protein
MVEKPKIPVTAFQASTAWRVARISIFTALSAVGSFIKPNPTSSIAFDSFAGFFVALAFGPFEGALVCGFGHLATAVVSGFPFGILHIPIAIGMALAGAAIGLLNKMHKRWGFIPALIVGVTINTALVFPLVPWLGSTLDEGMIIATGIAPVLTFVAALNAIAAAIVYVALRGKMRF